MTLLSNLTDFKKQDVLVGKDVSDSDFNKHQSFINSPQAKNQLVQIAKVLPQLYQQFEQKLDETAKAVGGHNVMKNTGIKRMDSAVGKVIDKHAIEKKDNYQFKDMTDWIRGTIAVDNEQQAYNALKYVENHWKIADKPIDYFKHPNKGYRGLHVIVTLGYGLRGEIQIHTPQSLSYKLDTMKEYEKYGYKKYSQLPDTTKNELEKKSQQYFGENVKGKGNSSG